MISTMQGDDDVAKELVFDVAHLGHVELLTPKPEKSLDFFTEVLGMQEVKREGDSVFLRCWGEWQQYSIKLTASAQAGVGHTALRAMSPEALERRAAAIADRGLAVGWTDGDFGHGKTFQFHGPDGHLFELYYEQEKYQADRKSVV